MKNLARTISLVVFPLSFLGASACGGHPMGSAEDMQGMDMHHDMAMQPMDMQPMTKQPTRHQMANYTMPQVTLVRDDGKMVALAQDMNDGDPVIMNFVFTGCNTICPLASRTLEELQDKLGSERDRVHMVSISVDPEEDTQEVLAKYAKRFNAGKQWHFYTGTIEASIAAQKAFAVYTGDKMDHNPVTFIRAAPGQPWLRIDGFAKSDELLRGLRDMEASREAMLPGGGY
jgi:protein SCO1/2